MASTFYSYSTDHKAIPLNRPLWKIRANRPQEWQEITRILEDSPKELFDAILAVPEIKSILQNYHQELGMKINLFSVLE